MKKNKKLFIISIIIVLIILIIGFFSSFSTLKKEKNNEKFDKTLPILFLIVDKDKTDKNINIYDASHGDDIQLGVVSSAIAIENGKYSFELKHVNDKLLEDISDFVFTLHDPDGNIITTAEFDKKTKLITLPDEYYRESNKDYSNSTKDESPIQMQIVSRMKKSDFENLKISVNTNGIFKNKKNIYIDARDTITSLSLKKYDSKKVINKNDIDVYINNSTDKLKSEYYNWDNKSGTLTININPLFIKQIDIKYSTKFTKILNLIKNVFAVDFKKISGFYKKLDSIDESYNWTGKSWTKELSFKYIGSSCYNNINNCTWGDRSDDTIAAMKKSFNTVDDYLCFSTDGSTSDACGEGAASYHPFIINLSGVTLSKDEEITNTDGTKTTVTHSIKFKSNTYVTIFCDEENSKLNSADDNKIKITIKVVKFDSTNDYIVFSFDTKESNANQEGYGIVKFNWEKTNYAKIHVEKYWKDMSGTTKLGGIPGIRIGLYDDSNCSSKISSKYTNSNGNVTFSHLDLDTYYVKEMSFGKATTPYDSNHWALDTTCHKVTVSTTSYDSKETDDEGATIYVKNVSVTQRKKYYCYKVKKVDADNTSCNISGISFTSSNGETQTTGSDGVATFQNLEYGTYTYYESSTDPSSATSSCGGTYNYWNENQTATTATITEMNYDAATNTYSCGANPETHKKQDHKVYYCLKVKKIDDATGNSLAGATIEIKSLGLSKVTGSDGIATFMLGTNSGNFSVEETVPPTGYALSNPNPITVTATAMAKGTTLAQSQVESNCNATVTDGYTFKNPTLVLNWYKVTENLETKAENAEFEVTKKGTTEKIHYNGKMNVTDTNGVTKNCYIYSSDTTKPTIMVSNSTSDKGDVCIRGIPAGTYTITETKPSQYHTFGEVTTKDINVDSTSTVFKPMDNSNKFINIPTGFEFTKKVANVDGGDGDQKIVVNGVEKSLTELTTEELKKLDFEIYVADSSGNPTGSPLEFVLKNGIYEYVGNTIDGPGETEKTTILHLNDERKIRVDHLAWGTTYVIREVQSRVCDTSKTEDDCIGYYYPNYGTGGQTSTFTITTCSNPSANTTSCPSGTNKYATQELTNTPTEIQFTKKDFYNYNDQADIEDTDRESDEVDESVEFETDKERSDFDRIVFKLRDSDKNYLTLKFIGNHGDCKTDKGYAEYRYVPSDQTDEKGTELHTCGGHIRITNLCRGNKYTIEEISVPEDSVYVKENENKEEDKEENPTANFTVGCTDGDEQIKTSKTTEISNKPTRARFEKRDSKYNYLISDMTTTFKLYRCDKGTECHPGDYTTDEEREANGMELVKFYPRRFITGDEEDPNDAEGLIGVEVYRRMSDSDAEKQGAKIITELHPYRGILVMRYLQANYNYVLLETVAPKNYQMPIGRNAENPFTTTSETVDVDPVDIPNKPTSLLIKKYDSKGNLLPGAEFKIYEGTTCNPNLSAMNQPKKELKLKTIRDGIYENRETKDTDTVKTCTDKENEKCSDINPNGSLTKLTYQTNLGTWTDFADESTSTKDGKKIEIQEGTALVQYLEYGHCYIIEEVKAPEGHTLPKKPEDRFTMITIDENDEYAHSTYYKFINKPTPFQFYKYDEFNQLIDGAEFKLQKLDDNKKYQDVTVTLDNDLENLATIDDTNSEELNKKIEEYKKQAEEGVPFYKVDKESSNTTITTKNGTAVVYYLPAGQYRILETKAPEGKELPKNPNIATFFVDENGNVYGNSVITNKNKTIKIERKNEASAIFIIGTQTGQTVIKYGLLISVLIALITGLIILKKKME